MHDTIDCVQKGHIYAEVQMQFSINFQTLKAVSIPPPPSINAFKVLYHFVCWLVVGPGASREKCGVCLKEGTRGGTCGRCVL